MTATNRPTLALAVLVTLLLALPGCSGDGGNAGGSTGSADTSTSGDGGTGDAAEADSNGADGGGTDTGTTDAGTTDTGTTDTGGGDTGTTDTGTTDSGTTDGAGTTDGGSTDADAGASPCNTAKDCPPGAPCTVPACFGGVCAYAKADDGAACLPVSSCSTAGTCQAGVCVGEGVKDCNDGSVCTADSCVPSTGECAHEPTNGGVVCDDGNACTFKETCYLGVCVAGAAKNCDDDNPCTQDVCDGKSGTCLHKPANAGGACDDGNTCTESDACDDQGACVGGKNTCACKVDDDCKAFEDGKLCNGTLFCDQSLGQCALNPATVITCADSGEPCTVNACDEDKGACSLIPVPEGQACDDGNICTTGTACDGKGGCGGGEATCACVTDADCSDGNDANPCNGTLFCNKAKAPFKCEVNPATVVVCDSAGDTDCAKNVCSKTTGTCAMTEVPNKTACDDGEICTKGDACLAGKCKAGTDVCKCSVDADCLAGDDGNLCNGIPFCNVASGQCEFNPASVVQCKTVDDTYCSKNTCQPKTGECVMLPTHVSESCDDGNDCTVGEVCDEKGQCTPSKNLCACNADSDCAGQEDGNACNGTLFCNKAKGECELDPTTVVSCPTVDDTICVANTCQKKTGQCELQPRNDGFACDADGNACTKGDYCTGGSCKAGPNTCECQADADCADKQAADLCSKLYCNGISKTCEVNPATKVFCSPQDDTNCAANTCNPTTGKCAMKPRNEGLACDADGSNCTTGDKCVKGACEAGPSACQCTKNADCAAMDDGNPCNGELKCSTEGKCIVDQATVVTCQTDGDTPCLENRCDKADGSCKLTPVNEKSPCGNGTLCTGVPLCNEGTCTTGKDVDCDDQDPCTTDSCDDYKGCIHTAVTSTAEAPAPCDDGNLCTTDDVCVKGSCTGSKKDCNEGTPCTIDACHPLQGCKYVPRTGSCDDGDPCTVDGVCVGIKCVTKAKDCDDGDACTIDSCDSKLGCQHTVSTADCDDGNACTKGDTCATGACKGKPIDIKAECDDGNACTTEGCVAAIGCTYDKPSIACDDGDFCTSGDVCVAGACKGGTSATCDDSNPCTLDVCDKAKGQCTSTNLANGESCEDGNACTESETCSNGVCKGGKSKPCDDGDPCTADGCNKLTGCTAVVYPDDDGKVHACDDGDYCTVGTACKSGVCQGGGKRVCDDGEPCTTDSCDSKAGACVFATADNDGAPCGDAADCQTKGVCKQGQCIGAIARPWSHGGLGVVASCGDLIDGDNGGWFVFGQRESAAGVREPAIFEVRFSGTLRQTMVRAQGKDGMFWNGQRLGDGSFLAVGETLENAVGGTDGLFAKIPAGVTEITDVHRYGGLQDDSFTAVLSASDGGAHLVGTTRSKGQGGADGWLVRVDKTGKAMWEKTYGTPIDDVFTDAAWTKSDRLTLIGRLGAYGGWIVHVDPDGKALENITLGNQSKPYAFTTVLPTSGGGFVVAGERRVSYAGAGTLLEDVEMAGVEDIAARPGGKGYAAAVGGEAVLYAPDWTVESSVPAAAEGSIGGKAAGRRAIAVGTDSIVSLGRGGCAVLQPDNFGNTTCAVSGACFTKQRADCDDNSKCTKTDTCLAGECAYPGAKSCKDASLCTTDACDPKTGNCVFTPLTDGAVCNGSDSDCAVAGQCKSGACVGNFVYSFASSIKAEYDCCGAKEKYINKVNESQRAHYEGVAVRPDGSFVAAGPSYFATDPNYTLKTNVNSIWGTIISSTAEYKGYSAWREVVPGCNPNNTALVKVGSQDAYQFFGIAAMADNSAVVLAKIPDISGVANNQCGDNATSTFRTALNRWSSSGGTGNDATLGNSKTEPVALATHADGSHTYALAKDLQNNTSGPAQFSVYRTLHGKGAVGTNTVEKNFRYGYGDADAPVGIDATPDGGFVLCGNTKQSNQGTTVVARMDKDGKQSWSDLQTGVDGAVVYGCGWTADGPIVAGRKAFSLAGSSLYYVWARALDVDGKVRFDVKSASSSSTSTFGRDVLPKAAGFALGGEVGGSQALLRFDAAGNLVGQRNYGGVVYQWRNAPNDGFVGAGRNGGFNVGGGSRVAMLLRADPFGLTPCESVGACKGKKVADCDDGNGCTADLCVADVGCKHVAFTAEVACSDGDPCSGPDLCGNGACKATGSLPQKTPCEDGNLCTKTGLCAANGACLAPATCDDGKPCTADLCDAKTGSCSHQPIAEGGACDDGDGCTGDTTCDAAGTCAGGKDLCADGSKFCNFDADCDDKNPCTVEVCKDNKCVYTDVEVGASCDDGSKCTEKDACDASGKCAGTPLDCADTNPCTVDTCSESVLCVHTPANDGATCDDGNKCTSDTKCKSGMCIGTSKCEDGEICTVASCDADGNCVQTPALNGVDCDGGFNCDGSGACVQGSGAAGVLAGSQLNSCAIYGGKLYCWGNGSYGTNGDGTKAHYNTPHLTALSGTPVDVAMASSGHTACAVVKDAQGARDVWCWGNNANDMIEAGGAGTYLAPTKRANTSGAVAVSVSLSHACAVFEQGHVACWGYGGWAQLNGSKLSGTQSTPIYVDGITDAVQVATGLNSSCALQASGKITCWGLNDQGQLGAGNLDAGNYGPVDVALTDKFKGLTAGFRHYCGQTTSNDVWCWGDNSYGQLGDGTKNDSKVPVKVMTGANGRAVLGAGVYNTCVMDGGEWLHCWGRGGEGQIGDGNFTDVLGTTVKVVGSKLWMRAVSSFGYTPCMLQKDGNIYCWGPNNYGQLGDGTYESRNVPTKVTLP